MIVEVAPHITARVVDGPHLPFQPRLWLQSRLLIVGPYHSSGEQEEHFLDTVGYIDWLRLGSDALCFGKNDHLLKSVLFHIPDASAAVTSTRLEERVGSPVSGLLEITESKGFFLEMSDLHSIDLEGDVLALLGGKGMEVNRDSLRLRIAPDIDLLFSNRRLSGVLLLHPARYLVGSWADAAPTQPDPSLTVALRDYLALVSVPNIQRMEDRAPDLLDALRSLHKRLVHDPGGGIQAAVLRAALEDVADRFYGQELTGD